jgi:hypothetical protein
MTNHPITTLRVSRNRRYLTTADGTPFLYLADTAWELVHRLDRAEADRYLADRAAKGFTVIQTVLLFELGTADAPNAYGDPPLIDADPARPNEPYFAHVDTILNQAAEYGLVVGLLPTWGSKWALNEDGETGIFTPETARTYGRFLGERYRDASLIWILGGDRNAVHDEERAVIAAMAEGLRAGDGGAHLITYHPMGPGQSSELFPEAAWLDFHMNQSSHGARDHDNGLFTARDYALQPVKPTVDGEPRYETIPVGFYNRNASDARRFTAYDVRQAAYWSMLAGACGHTYGNNNVWQMWAPGREPRIGACTPWDEALNHPGAFQMGILRRLFEARSFHKLVPDAGLVLDGPRTGGAKIRAALAADGTYGLVYSPRGEPFTVQMAMLASRRVAATWFDPRYGIATPIHTTITPGIQTFTPPTSGRGCDWVLVLDDATADLPAL